MKQYSIGQVVYLLVKKDIIPAAIVKEVVEKTVSGTVVEYVALLAAQVPKEVNLSSITKDGGEVFESPQSLNDALVQRATRAIAKYIEVAVSKSAQFVQKKTELEQHVTEQVPNDVIDNVNFPSTIVLPDGTLARVRMPT